MNNITYRILDPDNQLVIEDNLSLFNIKHEFYELWNDQLKQHVFPANISNVCYVITIYQILYFFHTYKIEFINFMQSNIILIDCDTDSILWPDVANIINTIKPKQNQIFMFNDGVYVKEKINNLVILDQPLNHFIHITEIIPSVYLQKDITNDFLLTMYRNDSHRHLLLQELHNNNLIENNIVSYGMKHIAQKYNNNYINVDSINIPSNWLGETPTHNWHDGYASPDLYNKCGFEIVTETLFENNYFITEKTIKPIIMKTPFVILSTRGYLKFLKSLGFKTFNTLINEDYDDAEDLEERVKLLVNTVKEIINYGTAKFVRDAEEICLYNYNHLCYLKGMHKVNQALTYKKLFDLIESSQYE